MNVTNYSFIKKPIHNISLKDFSTIVHTTETFIGKSFLMGNKFNLR